MGSAVESSVPEARLPAASVEKPLTSVQEATQALTANPFRILGLAHWLGSISNTGILSLLICLEPSRLHEDECKPSYQRPLSDQRAVSSGCSARRLRYRGHAHSGQRGTATAHAPRARQSGRAGGGRRAGTPCPQRWSGCARAQWWPVGVLRMGARSMWVC